MAKVSGCKIGNIEKASNYVIRESGADGFPVLSILSLRAEVKSMHCVWTVSWEGSDCEILAGYGRYGDSVAA